MQSKTQHMKNVAQKRIVFVAKSMMWSLLLYGFFMLAFNWEDVSNKVRGINPITVVNNIPSGTINAAPATAPASIATRGSGLNLLLGMLNEVGNIIN